MIAMDATYSTKIGVVYRGERLAPGVHVIDSVIGAKLVARGFAKEVEAKPVAEEIKLPEVVAEVQIPADAVVDEIKADAVVDEVVQTVKTNRRAPARSQNPSSDATENGMG